MQGTPERRKWDQMQNLSVDLVFFDPQQELIGSLHSTKLVMS
jgi:hypothetical protein